MRITELRDLVIAAVVLSFVFIYQGIDHLVSVVSGSPIAYLMLFGTGLLFVALSFIGHEMAHRYFARRYGCFAEFRLWKFGLLMAVLLAFGTNGAFIFAAPGAVVIYPKFDLWGRAHHLHKKQLGIVSIAGPVVNMILAGMFAVLGFMFGSMFFLGTMINIWLALFNTLPIGTMDGRKIMHWNKKVWAVFLVIIIVLFVFSFVFLS